MELKNGMKGAVSGSCGLALAGAVTSISCGRLEGGACCGAWTDESCSLRFARGIHWLVVYGLSLKELIDGETRASSA